ncbi:MAG: hypothetical protein S4CHLAM102_01440 [Chlamydiia bacterium]|nr:hypothetical protein [Chlamydiia bacterium]
MARPDYINPVAQNSWGAPVHPTTSYLAVDEIDEKVAEYMRDHHNLLRGEDYEVQRIMSNPLNPEDASRCHNQESGITVQDKTPSSLEKSPGATISGAATASPESDSSENGASAAKSPSKSPTKYKVIGRRFTGKKVAIRTNHTKRSPRKETPVARRKTPSPIIDSHAVAQEVIKLLDARKQAEASAQPE